MTTLDTRCLQPRSVPATASAGIRPIAALMAPRDSRRSGERQSSANAFLIVCRVGTGLGLVMSSGLIVGRLMWSIHCVCVWACAVCVFWREWAGRPATHLARDGAQLRPLDLADRRQRNPERPMIRPQRWTTRHQSSNVLKSRGASRPGLAFRVRRTGPRHARPAAVPSAAAVPASRQTIGPQPPLRWRRAGSGERVKVVAEKYAPSQG